MFENLSSQTARIYWIDFGGSQQFFAVLDSGETVSFSSYKSHPWMVTDTSDNCIVMYWPDANQGWAPIRD